MNQTHNIQLGSKYPAIIHSYLSNWDSEWVIMKTLEGSYPTTIKSLSDQYQTLEQETYDHLQVQSPRPNGNDTMAVLQWMAHLKTMAQELTIVELTNHLEQQFPMEATDHSDLLPF